jgi:sugar phosphate isomerase/epimerase
MRLGAPLFETWRDPHEWAEAHRRLGYGAAYSPDVKGSEEIEAYSRAAAQAGLVIAEVGAWSNPMSSREEERKRSIAYCQERLGLAERIGARCCVNIAGSLGDHWDGPDPRDLLEDTFDLVVETTREIIDAVKPQRTFYTLETMPWMVPDSIESYERLVNAIDRPAFGVHFDPVNLINCPSRYFNNAAYLREFIQRLGGRIRSVHAKDIRLETRLTVHLDECLAGTGGLDYPALLRGLAALDPDLPLMSEHLSTADEYSRAVAYIRQAAAAAGVKFLC